jgi:ElaB/YqjD/DUF883 family membrane-anchored ribosome-binding protein
MSDEQTTQEPWREVGDQFKTLGEGLSRAFRTAWESEENRQHLESIKSGLKAMVDQVGQALEDASASPEGQKVRREAEKAAESARVAGEKALEEARPHVLSAVRQINAELEKWIRGMEGRGEEADEPDGE